MKSVVQRLLTILAILVCSAFSFPSFANSDAPISKLDVGKMTIEVLDIEWPNSRGGWPRTYRVVKICIEGTAYWATQTAVRGEVVVSLTPALKDGKPQVCVVNKK